MASGQSFTLSIKALFDASDIKAKVGDIQKSFSNLRLPDNLKRSLDTSFTSLNKALNDFEQRAAKGVTSKTDAKGITSSLEKVINEFNQVDKVISKVKQELGSGADLSKLIKLDDATLERLRNLKKEIDDIQQQLANINASKIDNIKKSLEQIKTSGARKQGEAALKLFEEGDVQNAITTLDKIIKKLEDYKRAQADTGKDLSNVEASLRALGQMRTDMDQAQSQSSTLVAQQNEKAAESAQILSQAQQNVVNQVNQSAQAMSNYGQQASNASTGVNNLATNQANLNKELDQVKSRIQYFLGLSNTINLVKRAIRSAVSTVKELDKAMTETAVVTQNTVSDMWAKLPEYTKRANQLGVSTLAAYQSATLYYQQGLNDEQAADLSVETLKMARIAGLEAAEATDRMTNALRGFNMELNAMNAQRVDDVYSQLAAMSASNVDEISTAMTKVASLAHSAGMEFETTSAFLAQIIETTRESAETAGTALKTVVARFSEVKKLVDTNQLKGQDEEGELIDVNKVSTALRTAGIDLNKYFLGEVGLDDIFMELASKWDTLTSVQQRYIATQAAGSRQQSRFIALMQDYARTQELVSAAYDSEGASQRQFEKTQDSLESKLARLKNAWNEFLMGITNSSVIKAAVDALRTLLDIINKITGAFGQGASGVLKFATAAAGIVGLRAAFRSGGIAEKLLGSLGNTLPGRILGLGGNTNSQVVAAGAQFHTEVVAAGAEFAAAVNGAAAGQVVTGGTGTAPLVRTPWQAIQNFKRINAGNAEAYQLYQSMAAEEAALGNRNAYQQELNYYRPTSTLFGALGKKFGIGTGAAISGAAALATAIGGIAAAAGIAYIAIKKVYDASPEGKLAAATKEAEKLNKQADESKQKFDSLKSTQKTYSERTAEVENATTAEDKQKAILDRNEAILNAIQEDNTLTQYVITEQIDDQIVLTLNEEALAEAAAKAAEIAAQAAIDAYFGEAKQNFAQSDVYEKQFNSIFSKIISEEAFETGTDTNRYNGYNLNDKLQYILNSQVENGTKDNALRLFNLINQSENLGGKRAELGYAEILKNLNVSDEIANLLITAAGKGTTSKETVFTQTELKSFADLLSGPTGEAYAKALSLYLDKEDFSGVNLTLSNINTEDILGDLDLTQLEKLTDKTSEELKTIIQQNIQRQREQQKQVNTETTSKTIQVGRNLGWEDSEIASTVANIYATSSFEEQKAINDLLNSITNDQIAGAVLQNLDDSGLREWVTGLDFSKPIETLLELQSTAKKVKEGPIHDLATSLQQDLQFSGTSLLESFITSTDYESLTESLDEFIDENEKLSSSNILELAEANETLDNLLKTGTMSAKALAVALTGIETGEIQVWDLNDAIIAALNSMDDLGSITKRTIDDFNSFDPGYDENDIIGFSNKVIENATANIEKGAWGNNQMRNYMEYIFGEYSGAPGEDYQNWLTSNLSWLEANKENMQSAWADIASASEEAAIASGDAIPIWEENGEIIIDIVNQTTDDLIKYLHEQKGLTEQQARMMIADYKNYSDDFALTLEQNDLENAVATWAEKAGEKGWYLDKDLQTLAKLLRADTDQIKQIFEDLGYDLKEVKFGEGTVEDIERILQEADKTKYKVTRAEAWNVPETVQGYAPKGYFDKEFIDFNELKQSMMDVDLAGYFESTINQMVQAGDSFMADFGNGLEEVKVKAGETAVEAYARAAEESANQALAGAIGEAVVAALEGEHNIQIGAETDEATEKINTLFKLVDDEVSQDYSTTIAINTEAAVVAINNLATAYSNLAGSISAVNAASSGGGGGATTTSGAKGGFVESYGSGAFRVKPGLALTGEEGPEIVWNKEKGYAYVTGQNHPEFQDLRPGDRVFDARETRKILGSMASGGVVNAYSNKGVPGASRRVHGYGDTKTSTGSSGSLDDKDDYKKESTWRNELDWLYDLMEDIAEEERKQTEIQSRYELAVKDLTKTGKDLFNLTKQELASLTTQLDAQNTAFIKRTQQMGELQTLVNSKGFQDYLQWNQKDQTLEIDWDKIEAIQDKDTYEELTDLISRMESVQDQMDDAQKSILDIKKQIEDLQNRYLQQYLDFQKRVLDAVVKQYQEAIDNLSELNSTLTDTNQSILDSIQKEIDLERQIRDNTDTEQNIADMEARLAYLQRDTSGANDTEIRQLQKQLEDAREGYADTLVDQALERLSQTNDEATQQREKQIELMQAQLDYWQESGALWGEVADLMATGFSGDGSILQDSDLWEILKSAESWESLSEAQKKNWANELILTANEVGAHLVQLSGGIEVNADLVRSSIAETNGILTSTISVQLERVRAILAEMGSLGGTPEHSYTSEKTEGEYASGGLNTTPGRAILHGTANEPEYVLNARQTDAFLKLADVLPTIMSGNANTSTFNYGNSMFDININVQSISNDYDVDRLVARLKDDLADVASYRNVNALNFIR